jgi:hypothetical protein
MRVIMTSPTKIVTKILILLLMFIGCFDAWEELSETVEVEELYGRYVGNFGETDVNYFDLLPDSLYISYYKDKKGQVYTDSGTWWLVEWSYGIYDLIIYDYEKRYPGVCQKPVEGVEVTNGIMFDPSKQAFRVKKKRGMITVTICYDKGWYFKKIPDKNNNQKKTD